MTNIAARFSKTPGSIRHTGRTAIGYDTEDVLKSIGMSDREIEELINGGIIRTRHK
jgi:crotonobetainyl-CoA:carnitine CoA-transferase CaiB-like acyl-CoA transferase